MSAFLHQLFPGVLVALCLICGASALVVACILRPYDRDERRIKWAIVGWLVILSILFGLVASFVAGCGA